MCDILAVLARIQSILDPGRGAQAEEMAELAGAIALEMGMEESEAGQLRAAARLCDFGMLALAEPVRKATGPFSAGERLMMQRHTVLSGEMFAGSRCPSLELARSIALGHHERWDGMGYPYGLKGTEIPQAARIVAVAQAFQAMIAAKPYRAPLPRDEALAEVERQSGFAFDPEVVQALLRRAAVLVTA